MRTALIAACTIVAVGVTPHAAWAQQFSTRQPDRERAAHVLMEMRAWPKRERQRLAMQPLAFASSPRQKTGSSALNPRAPAGSKPVLAARP